MSLEHMQGSWIVTLYRSEDGLVPPVDGTASIDIDGDRLAGIMGVNRLMGPIDDDGASGPLATTMMAGPQHLMDQERALLQLMGDSDAVVVGERGMTWLHDGLTVVEFERSGTTGEPDSS